MTEDPILEVSDACFAYPGRAVLSGLHLSVHSGEIVVLLGPNGAGKSTLIKALSGRIDLAQGTVRIQGGDPRNDAAARRVAGFVPQKIAVYEKLTVRENLLAFAELMQVEPARIKRRVDGVLGFVRLLDRQNEVAANLSGGMRRRLNIGAALVHLPRLLVLDEPTAGIDVDGRHALVEVLRSLRARGMAILLVTHDMGEAEALADRVAFLVDGAIAADGPPGALVAERFGGQRLVSVGLCGSSDHSRRIVERRLTDAGLAHLRGAEWAGLMDNDRGEVTDLVGDVLASDMAASTIHVRRPGLDTLLAFFNERRG